MLQLTQESCHILDRCAYCFLYYEFSHVELRPPPADNQQETVSIKIRKVQGEVMVVSEESGVREEFGSTDTDEYKID